MMIKEFSILHYGPVRGFMHCRLKGFNLLFGKNEEGKTLIIDALLRMLFGKFNRTEIGIFKGIDRVQEEPEGYIVLSNKDDREIKLPQRSDFEKISGITNSDCRNIFVIRDSDLSISREGTYYEEITDRLTGLRTKEIEKIKECLRREGQITKGGAYIDTKDEKVKSSIESANVILFKIDALLKMAKANGIDTFENELVSLTDKKCIAQRDLNALLDARKRQKYEKGACALAMINESLENLKGLEGINDEDRDLWRELEIELKRLYDEKGDLVYHLKETESRLDEIKRELRDVEREFRIIDDKRRGIDEEIRPELNQFKERMIKNAGKPKRGIFTKIAIFSTILLFLSIFGMILRSAPVFSILILVSLIFLILSYAFIFKFIRDDALLSESFKRINLALSGFGLNADDFIGINRKIYDFMDVHAKMSEQLRGVEVLNEQVSAEIENIKRGIDKRGKDIREIEGRISLLKTRSGIDSLEDYSKRLALKKEYTAVIREKRGVLETIMESKGSSLKDDIVAWGREIDNLSKFKDSSKGIEYSEQLYTELNKEMEIYDAKLEEIRKKTSEFKGMLNDIIREADAILRYDVLLCETLEELEEVRMRLINFVKEKDRNRVSALKAIEIFDGIEKEEKERIIELFGRERSISNIFSSITGGKYKEVLFNQVTGGVNVICKDNMIMEAEKLSGGAYDQLYLSIRIALGEMLLKGRKGFFIMDDPFIKADCERLKRQMDILKQISDSGWQIIYFSAKDEIRSCLLDGIEKGWVNYVTVNPEGS